MDETMSEEQFEPRKRKMSRAEAGRKGGLTTKQRHGDDHFSKIGRLGGKKGGEATKQRYGVEFYQQIGRKGGSN
jgi:general stress protein YciG